MFFSKLKRTLIKKYLAPDCNIIYSQSGEDLIIQHLFSKLNIDFPNYLDIGANDPKRISNTYNFYLNGSSGVLIEPNPFLFKKLKNCRSRDVVINCGIGLKEEKKANFYLFSDSANGLSTFSEKEARYWSEIGMKGRGKIQFDQIIEVDLVPINDVIENYFEKLNKRINFISIDVEGLDFEIVKSIDIEKFKPDIFCLETLMYDENQKEIKNIELIKYLEDNGYEMYADTRINSIFCRKELIGQ
jgi:FkbM family methyltransferase